MKKQSTIWTVVILAVIIIAIIFVVRSHMAPGPGGAASMINGNNSASVSPTETTKLSSSLSKFQNEELGFSVNYPTSWQIESAPAGATFIIPDQFPETTIGTLEASIQVIPGTCAFPPVVSVKDKGQLNVGSLTFDTMTIQNSVQGRGYFDHFYSLQNGNVCYMFLLDSVTLNPTTKGFSSSDVPKITANNQSHISDADAAFNDVVKSFTFVAPPAGEPETSYHPTATSTGK
ncbi:MAG: hypothetical protein KGJ35_01705 [Patescibacteria group bacterium]|nr:hypothetical protein [Patescibacteria group bacterium]